MSDKYKLNCEFHFETDIGFPTSQMIYFRKKDLLLTALNEGEVLFWDMKQLMAKGKLVTENNKKMIKIINDIHSV